MNEIVLSRDADKMICTLYRDYLERRKNGRPKREARQFEEIIYWGAKKMPKVHPLDLEETFKELNRTFHFKTYINGNFELNDDCVIYMEGRFKKGLKEVIEFLAKFI